MLNIAKSNQEIVENTHSKPKETLEFEMIKQKESFSFDVPLELNEKWIMGVTSLVVYNTVYNITSTSNKLQILLTKEQLRELGIDTELVMLSIDDTYFDKYKTYNLGDKEYNEYNDIVEKAN